MVDQRSLREVFRSIDPTLATTDQFFQDLIVLATDFSPVNTLLNSLPLRGRPQPQQLGQLKSTYEILVYARVYYFTLAQARSRATYRTLFTIFIGLNQNFHQSNVFHSLVTRMLCLVASLAPYIVVGPPLITYHRGLFVEDKIHFSRLGSRRKTSALIQMHKAISRVANGTCEELAETLQAFGNRLQQRQQNWSQDDFFQPRVDWPEDDFDRVYYPWGTAHKRLAVWISHKNLPPPAEGGHERKKLSATHGTSTQRDLVANSEFSIQGRDRGDLLRFPAIVTVQPGGTAFELASDFAACRRLRPKSDVTAYFSILWYGTNEKLSTYDVITGMLHNMGLIAKSACSICQRRRRRQYPRGRRRRPRPRTTPVNHGDPEFLRHFSSLLQNAN